MFTMADRKIQTAAKLLKMQTLRRRRWYNGVYGLLEQELPETPFHETIESWHDEANIHQKSATPQYGWSSSTRANTIFSGPRSLGGAMASS